jgi:hypothetical protein
LDPTRWVLGQDYLIFANTYRESTAQLIHCHPAMRGEDANAIMAQLGRPLAGTANP